LWRAALFRLSQPIARVMTDAPAPPRVTAKAVYCLDTKTGSGLLAKNAAYRFAPASLIKLLTALLLLEEDLQADVEIVARDCVMGSTMGLRPGDILTRMDLLYGLLLPSGNDAAHALARVCGGAMLAREGSRGDPVSRFVAAMNHLALGLGLTRTRAVNPSGFDGPGQYSTARDLARLGAVAFSHPRLRQVCSSPRYVVQCRGPAARTVELTSSVKMHGEPGFICGKTGSSPDAGAGLVFCADIEGRELVISVVASQERYHDARTIMTSLRATSIA
jgi:D-alanyl-D-alanine carboxypeptidase (penicillin-binding protein 5/6)